MELKTRIDPRIQFILLILMGVAVLFANAVQLLALSGFALFYLVLNGRLISAMKSLLFLALLALFHWFIQYSDVQILKYFGFFTFLVLRFFPIGLIANVLQDVPSGALMSSLQKIGLPKHLIITLSVTLRFFPIISHENAMIQMSAKLRGLSIRQPKNWLHPLSSFEYTIVPLMMRTLKISDELAASAMTKGIDYPQERSSVYDLHIAGLDRGVMIIFIVWIVSVYAIVR